MNRICTPLVCLPPRSARLVARRQEEGEVSEPVDTTQEGAGGECGARDRARRFG